MLIDTKIHAMEILEYALYGSGESEKKEIIRESMVELRRFKFSLDEEVFFKEIWKREDGKKFLEAHGVCTLEELVIRHLEYKMKFEWKLYKNVDSMIDSNEDDLEEVFYLD